MIRMRNYRLIHAACVAAALLATTTQSRAELGDAGSNAADFLRLGNGAAAAAQGEAYAGRSGSIEVMPYNPAGLRWMERSEIMLQHNEYLSDIRSEYIAGATQLGSFRIGASLNYLDQGNFTRRTISRPNGAGSFDADAWTGSLALAAPLGQSFSIGVEARLFQENIDDASRTSGSANVGLHYRPRKFPQTELGVVARHLGGTVKFDRDNEKLPLEYAVGASSLVMERLRLSAEVAWPRNQNPDWKVGGDLRLVDNLFIRGGYNSRNDLGSGVSAGIGVKYKSLMFDYAWVDYNATGPAHRISVTAQFGETKSE